MKRELPPQLKQLRALQALVSDLAVLVKEERMVQAV
jgi:hypothetical protein